MADFRRWFLAFAALVLVLGSAVPASAQYGVICGTSAAVAPTLRHEGFTELAGDILLSCTKAPGASSTPAGTPVAQANITVNVGAPITSRILTGSVTEALLLVDDPGPTAQVPCLSPTNPTIACQVIGDGVGGEFQAPAPQYNVFQGITGLGGPGLAANTITFLGVPIDAPGTAGAVLTYRITNIRVDATGIAVGIPLNALVTSSSSTSIQITAGQDTAVVGFATLGLNQDISGQAPVVAGFTPSFLECENSPMTVVGTATFTEAFATAFKDKGATGQNTPGIVYNTESGLEITINGNTTGVADTGTRLQVWISNIPPGAVISVDSWAQSSAAVCTAVSEPCSPEPSDATLVTSSGSTPVDPFANTVTTVVDNSAGTAPIPGYLVQWEITNTNPFAIDSLVFNIYASLLGQPSNTLPNASTTGVGGFSPQAASAVPSEAIPTFSTTVPTPAAPTTLFTASQCVTYLLFPYITDLTGFDTGIAISNTSLDPLGTTPQNSGACTVTFYSGGAVATAMNDGGAVNGVYTTAVIPGGSDTAFLLSGLDLTGYNAGTSSVPTGYAIATCNFQYAHGYSFVSDFQLQHFAAAYLALIIPDASTRAATPFLCSAYGTTNTCNITGEQLVH